MPSKTAKTMQQFEAQVIQTFIEQMMPEATANNFGSGTAGGVWRSMLSEQIANQIAKAGGLGLREKVEAAIAARNNTAPPTVPSPPRTSCSTAASPAPMRAISPSRSPSSSASST